MPGSVEHIRSAGTHVFMEHANDNGRKSAKKYKHETKSKSET